MENYKTTNTTLPDNTVLVLAVSENECGQQYIAVIADTGEIVNTHFCSNFYYAKQDLARVKTEHNCTLYFLEPENPIPKEIEDKILNFYKENSISNCYYKYLYKKISTLK